MSSYIAIGFGFVVGTLGVLYYRKIALRKQITNQINELKEYVPYQELDLQIQNGVESAYLRNIGDDKFEKWNSVSIQGLNCVIDWIDNYRPQDEEVLNYAKNVALKFLIWVENQPPHANKYYRQATAVLASRFK